MNNNSIKVSGFKKLLNNVDWKLLLFLILILNVKLALKIPAILLMYLLQFNFKFGFSFKNSRLPLFYSLIILIGVAGYLVSGNYTNINYNIVFITGIGFWLACILAVHQIKLSVENTSTRVLHQTIQVFFIINIAVSLLNLAYIVWQTHALNPYLYQGQNQKYFISTGDFIKGLTFDTSTTNAVINAFGVIYFLIRKNSLMTLACMAVLILTGSNITNVFIVIILGYLFVANSNRDQKSIIFICLALLVLFMAKISPQNHDYLINKVKSVFYHKKIISPWPSANEAAVSLRPDSTLNPQERRQKIAQLYLDSIRKINTQAAPAKVAIQATLPETPTGKIYIPGPNLNLPAYQWLRTTPPEQTQLKQFVNNHLAELPISRDSNLTPIPGKIISVLQTINFFEHHPAKILLGDGVGNFSSKLAFRATGLNFSGNYPAKLIYINHDFLTNHLDIYLNFFSRSAESHSLINSPFAVYNQLLSEYGLLGLSALFAFYIGFFGRHYTTLTYGMPLLFMAMAIFFVDYWFEQLSVMIFFELLIFTDIKQHKDLVIHPNSVGHDH